MFKHRWVVVNLLPYKFANYIAIDKGNNIDNKY